MVYSVGIIGGGKIGLTIAHMLSMHDDVLYTVYDVLPEKDFRKNEKMYAGKASHVNYKRMPEDPKDATKEHDAIVSSAPFFVNKKIAKACVKTGTAYFDLTEDVETTKFIKKLADKHKPSIPLMPQMGLAPGAINIIANYVASDFEIIKDLELRVGALPLSPMNHMKYYLSWSTAGVVNEYCNPCEGLWNGEKVMLKPLEGYETVSLDGTVYEAFNTSGGVASMIDTYQDKAENLTYKTLRYPGHCDYMRFLIEDLNLGNNRDLFVKIMDQEVPYTTSDVVVIHVNCVGYTKDGLLAQRSYTNKIYGDTINGCDFSAIQVATASGVVPLILAFAKKKMYTGFVTSEAVKFDWFVKQPFGNVYKET